MSGPSRTPRCAPGVAGPPGHRRRRAEAVLVTCRRRLPCRLATLSPLMRRASGASLPSSSSGTRSGPVGTSSTSALGLQKVSATPSLVPPPPSHPALPIPCSSLPLPPLPQVQLRPQQGRHPPVVVQRRRDQLGLQLPGPPRGGGPGRPHLLLVGGQRRGPADRHHLQAAAGPSVPGERGTEEVPSHRRAAGRAPPQPAPAASAPSLRPLPSSLKIANYMKSQGVGRGDDVTIYMPMIPELPAAMVRLLRCLAAG